MINNTSLRFCSLTCTVKCTKPELAMNKIVKEIHVLNNISQIPYFPLCKHFLKISTPSFWNQEIILCLELKYKKSNFHLEQ